MKKPSHARFLVGLGGLAALVLATATVRLIRTEATLRGEAARLRQILATLEPVAAQKQELENQNRLLVAAQEANLESIRRLQGELEGSRAPTRDPKLTNSMRVQVADYLAFIEDGRFLREENLRLKADLNSKPRVPRFGAWLGANLKNVDGGVAIASMLEDGPAARSPLEVGDIVVGVDGETVPDAEAFKAMMARRKGGEVIAFEVLRRDTTLRLEVQPRDWPQ